MFMLHNTKALLIAVLALVVWSPLQAFGWTGLYLFGIHLNWIALIIGLGAVFIARDFINFKRDTLARHYIMAVILCPFWLIARSFVLLKSTN
jgi:hypothetical protein